MAKTKHYLLRWTWAPLVSLILRTNFFSKINPPLLLPHRTCLHRLHRRRTLARLSTLTCRRAPPLANYRYPAPPCRRVPTHNLLLSRQEPKPPPPSSLWPTVPSLPELLRASPEVHLAIHVLWVEARFLGRRKSTESRSSSPTQFADCRGRFVAVRPPPPSLGP
jgi:hypothetical protein